MSIESDAHNSYLVKWAFDLVARIVVVMGLAWLVVAVIAAGSSDDPNAWLMGAITQPFAIVGTIWFSKPPRVTSDPELLAGGE